MKDNPQMMTSKDAPETPMDKPDMPGSPLDDMIARVDEYISNPRLVTAETLKAMKMELEDLKSVMDKEETAEGEPMDHNGGGVSIMISNMKKGMKK